MPAACAASGAVWTENPAHCGVIDAWLQQLHAKALAVARLGQQQPHAILKETLRANCGKSY
jgi:hypothetical protein